MSLYAALAKRAEDGRPVRVGLIGAGKFGSMFLTQAPTIAGLHVAAIADVSVARARAALERVGWDATRGAAESIDQAVRAGTTWLCDDAEAVISAAPVDVVIDATGDPLAGVGHALAAIAHGKHVVMVNVEADALVGPALARRAAEAGVVYSLAYGDQPALICELVDWARACGFTVTAAGKGTKYLPAFHASTPETVWANFGIDPDEAARDRLNAQMFNSFIDGTKSAIEMTAVANATGLTPAPGGLTFPPCGTEELATVLRPQSAGGGLHHAGQVEVISSLQRDGSAVARDLRHGVYVVFEAPNDYTATCLRQYGLAIDPTGRYAAMYKPYHLIGLELAISVASAALRGEPTGAPDAFRADVVAVAKRGLAPGEVLDGEGGYTVWGRIAPAADSLAAGALPIGLAHGARVAHAVAAGEVVRLADVVPEGADRTLALRRELVAEQPARAA
jgi:predicted homoserine dehydrogenase-like protein